MNDTGPNNHDNDRARDRGTPRIAVGIAVGAGLGLVADRGRRLGRDRAA